MPDDHELPTNIVTPDYDDEGTPQGQRKRLPWSKPAVPTKATWRERRQFERAARKVAGE